jgi:uncharacterized protein (TIRG00374 family)
MKSKALGIGRVALGLGISGLLGWLVVRGLDWTEVGQSLKGISPSIVLLAILVFLMASFLRAFRWRVLFVTHDIASMRLFVIQNEGIGINNIMPLRVVSEPTQLAILSIKDKVKPATALATMGMERVIDVIASTLILTVALISVPQMHHFKSFVWAAIGFAIFVAVLVWFLAWGGQTLAFIRRISFLSAFTSAVSEMQKHPRRLAASLVVSILYWLMIGVAAWFVSVAANLSISPITATLVIMGTIFFATAIPAAPSALGTFEFAMMYMLGFFDVGRESSFGFALITHAVFFLPPTIIAAIFLPREGLEIAQRFRRLMPNWKAAVPDPTAAD